MRRHPEKHRTHWVGGLRADVLGANDGIVSTVSLIVGVAAAESGRGIILIAGIAGLVAEAMSLAAAEYVSASSQTNTETGDLAREGKWVAESCLRPGCSCLRRSRQASSSSRDFSWVLRAPSLCTSSGVIPGRPIGWGHGDCTP